MSDPSLTRYRVTFPKQGRLALLSHLELTHALERMIRRSGLPYAVTQGFSPHMRIGYGAALPVGVGSTCEIIDLFLTEYRAPSAVLSSLQASSPADLRPTQVVCVASSEPAAAMVFPFGTYVATISPSKDASWDGRISVPDVIEVTRESKTKRFIVGDFLVGTVKASVNDDGPILLQFTLETKQSGSLRADLFCENLMAASGIRGEIVTLTRVAQSRTASEE